MFKRHTSQKLNTMFEKNYQGASPDVANFVFIGKDPNLTYNIEDFLVFKYIEEYLTDGIQFIERYKVHHPFMIRDGKESPIYNGDGKTYHRNFAKLDLPVETLKKISFVELIGFPTTGIAGLNPSRFREYLFSNENRENLKKLDTLLNANDKKIFIAWGLVRYFKELNEKGMGFDRIAKFAKEGSDQYGVHEFDNNYIIHPHFSNAISNKNIADMSAIITSKS
jgi:hypothetical protein